VHDGFGMGLDCSSTREKVGWGELVAGDLWGVGVRVGGEVGGGFGLGGGLGGGLGLGK